MNDESIEETKETLFRQESESVENFGRATAGEESRASTENECCVVICWKCDGFNDVVTIRFVHRQYSRPCLGRPGVWQDVLHNPKIGRWNESDSLWISISNLPIVVMCRLVACQERGYPGSKVSQFLRLKWRRMMQSQQMSDFIIASTSSATVGIQ